MRGGEINFSLINEKEKGYLFGIFEGSGYKYHDKVNRHYQVEFYLNSKKDKKIINYLTKLLKKLKLNVNLYQDKRFNCKRIRVNCKNFFEFIDKDINLRKKSAEFKIGYISGLIDSEGYINNKKSYIIITNTNRRILEKIKNFLNSRGIKTSLSKKRFGKKDRLNSCKMYISVSFKNTPHLSIKAGKP